VDSGLRGPNHGHMHNLEIVGTLALALARLTVRLLTDKPRRDPVAFRLADE